MYISFAELKGSTWWKEIYLRHFRLLRWCPTLAFLRSLFLENRREYGGEKYSAVISFMRSADMNMFLKCMGEILIFKICDRLWEKGPLGSGHQILFYCSIQNSSFCAFKCTLKHKKLIFLTEVIDRIGFIYKV